MELLGFWREAEDGALELTEKGNAYVQDYCRRKLAKED